MDNNDTKFEEMFEMVSFLKDHAASKDELGQLEKRMGSLEGKMGSLEGRMGLLEGRIGSIESQMVTKDYLDDKLADLRGDLVGNHATCNM